MADLMVGLLHALRVEVSPDLAEHVLFARLLEVGLDHLARIGLRRIARDPHLARRPQAEQLVSPRGRPELQLLVMSEFPLEALLAILEARHLPS